MTTSSADPEKLLQYAQRDLGVRNTFSDDRRSVASLQASVRAASSYRNLDVPTLDSVRTVLSSMASTERFVRTVRAELLQADRNDNGGVVTVDDAVIAAALDAAGVGSPPPRMAFEPTTMDGLPRTSGFVDDPICAATGNMVHQDADLDLPGIARSLTVIRTYNSIRSRSGPFGAGWSSVLDVAITVADQRIEVALPDGAVAAFVKTEEGQWGSFGRRLHGLDRTDGGGWEVATDHRRSYSFNDAGELVGWRVGPARVEVSRTDGRITSLRELQSGRTVLVDWEGDLVVGLSAGDGRTVSYEYDGSRLVRATSAAGHLEYVWDDRFLTSVVDADGVAVFVNEYDDDGRVVRQTSPFGRITEYRYDERGLTVVVGDDGVRQAMVHDDRGNLTAVIDTDGSAMRLAYDHRDHVVEVLNRAGDRWQYRYDDATGQLVERVDPDGLSAAWAWDDQGRVVSQTDRSGGVTVHEYVGDLTTPVRSVDPLGAVTTIEVDSRFDQPARVVDPDGVEVDVEFDADGQIVTVVNGLGHRTVVEYDAAGRIAGGVDATDVVSRLVYDDGGRLVRTERGDQVRSITRTAAGRISGGTEPGDLSWSADFGPHGAPLRVTGAADGAVRLEYDRMGNVVATIAPDGAEYRQEYDEAGRLVATLDPTGAVTRRRYDREGNLVEVVDPEGRALTRTVDAFGRTVASTAPDGATTTFTYHPGGAVASVTAPDGRVWTTHLDGSGRTVALVDPDGGRSEIDYTPGGRLLARRSPAGREERFEHDAAGRVVARIDAAGSRLAVELDEVGRIVESQVGDHAASRRAVEWDASGRMASLTTVHGTTTFERDGGGRVRSAVDGAGVRTSFEWNERGLIDAAVDAAGGTTRYEYDIRGRLASQTTPGGGTSTWAYDAAGRVSSITDPTGVVTALDRDAGGLLTGLRRGDDGWTRRLDACGREVERFGLSGRQLSSFAYDSSGRLVEATTPSGMFTQFMWDGSDRVTALETPEGTTLVERDGDGWAVAMVQPDGVRTEFERDATGRIVTVRSDLAGELGRPDDVIEFDPAGRLTIGPEGTVYRYDDAGRLAERVAPDGSVTALEYDDAGRIAVERGDLVRRFEYDLAGRVAAVTVDGLGRTTFRYDDAGRRIGDTAPDGTETSYGWEGLDRLVNITRRVPGDDPISVDIELDPRGRPVRVGGRTISYDPIFGLPDRLGDVRVVNIGAVSWRSDDGVWGRLDPSTPAGLKLHGLTFLGARIYDAATRQFLSADPLSPEPGSNGASSAYTYAWHDPVNHPDPSGLRPISKEEWEAMRTREEQGLVGQAVQAIKDDPWGSLAAGVVIAGGALLLATPLAPVGAGILLGAAVSAGVGFATGTFDPRAVAIGGLIGGITAGTGSLATQAGWSTARVVAANAAVGSGGELAGQLFSGQPIDWRSVAVSGAVGGATAGVGVAVKPYTTTMTSSVTAGALTDGGFNVAEQALTGDGSINMSEVFLNTAGGGIGGGVEYHFDSRQLELDAPSGPPALPAPESRLMLEAGQTPESITVYRGTSLPSEQIAFDQTGLVMSEAARDAWFGTNGDVDIARSYSMSAEQYSYDVWGGQDNYVQAHGEFGGEVRSVSGDRPLVSVTTDVETAQRFAGKDGVVYRAEVPADSLVRQTLETSTESEYLAPHMLEMEQME